jgi:hypothetical protein
MAKKQEFSLKSNFFFSNLQLFSKFKILFIKIHNFYGTKFVRQINIIFYESYNAAVWLVNLQTRGWFLGSWKNWRQRGRIKKDFTLLDTNKEYTFLVDLFQNHFLISKVCRRKSGVGSKTAKNHYFGVENSFFQKIIGLTYFIARFRS